MGIARVAVGYPQQFVIESVFAFATPDEKLRVHSPRLVEDPAGFFGAAEQGPGLALEFIPLINKCLRGEWKSPGI